MLLQPSVQTLHLRLCCSHFADPASSSFGKLVNPKWDPLFGFQVFLVSRKRSFPDYLTGYVCVSVKNLVMEPCGLQDFFLFFPPRTLICPRISLSLRSVFHHIAFYSVQIAAHTTIFFYCWQLQLPLSSQGCNALFKDPLIHVTHTDLARLPQTEKTLKLASLQWEPSVYGLNSSCRSSRRFRRTQTEDLESFYNMWHTVLLRSGTYSEVRDANAAYCKSSSVVWCRIKV